MGLETSQDPALALVPVLAPEVEEEARVLVWKALRQADWQLLREKRFWITETDPSLEAADLMTALMTAAAHPGTKSEARALAIMCRKLKRPLGSKMTKAVVMTAEAAATIVDTTIGILKGVQGDFVVEVARVVMGSRATMMAAAPIRVIFPRLKRNAELRRCAARNGSRLASLLWQLFMPDTAYTNPSRTVKSAARK